MDQAFRVQYLRRRTSQAGDDVSNGRVAFCKFKLLVRVSPNPMVSGWRSYWMPVLKAQAVRTLLEQIADQVECVLQSDERIFPEWCVYSFINRVFGSARNFSF